MDTILTVAAVLAGLLVLFYAGLWLGFRIMPKAESPNIQVVHPVNEVKLPGGLPKVIRQYLEQNIGNPSIVPETVAAWGRGRMSSAKVPLYGTLWLPLSWEFFLQPGEEMVARVRVTLFARPFFRSTDLYLSGEGTRVAGQKGTIRNENVNRSEEILTWLYSLVFAPSIVMTKEGLTWQELSKNEVLLIVPSQHGESLEFRLTFDLQNSELVKIETTRPASSDGKPLPFTVECKGSRQFTDIVFLPDSLHTEWEGVPFQRFQVEGVRYNVNIESEIAAEIQAVPGERHTAVAEAEVVQPEDVEVIDDEPLDEEDVEEEFGQNRDEEIVAEEPENDFEIDSTPTNNDLAKPITLLDTPDLSVEVLPADDEDEDPNWDSAGEENKK